MGMILTVEMVVLMGVFMFMGMGMGMRMGVGVSVVGVRMGVGMFVTVDVLAPGYQIMMNVHGASP